MFRICESGIHGRGLFATCDIPADTPIFDEEVSIQMHVDLSKDSGYPKLLEGLVSKLSENQQVSLLDLSGDNLLDKLWMNGSPMIDFDVDRFGIGPRRNLGIYLKCARLNHACIPNAVRASAKDNRMSVVSQKDIAAGEEITISYMDDNFMVADMRELQMRSKIRVGKTWKGCRCQLCIGPIEQKMVSDTRRVRMHSYRERLLQGTLSKEVLVTEFLPLMAAEGLPCPLMGVHATIQMAKLTIGFNFTTRSPEDIAFLSFSVGTRIVFHKLKVKSELNGKTGTVVYPFNKTTGRIGILPDSSNASNKPIAVKPMNLCVVRRGSNPL